MEKSISSQEYAIFLRELRAARRASGATQIDVAETLGETQSMISKCERGERRLDVVELRAYCRAIGVPLSAFVDTLEKALAVASATASSERGGKTRNRKRPAQR